MSADRKYIPLAPKPNPTSAVAAYGVRVVIVPTCGNADRSHLLPVQQSPSSTPMLYCSMKPSSEQNSWDNSPSLSPTTTCRRERGMSDVVLGAAALDWSLSGALLHQTPSNNASSSVSSFDTMQLYQSNCLPLPFEQSFPVRNSSQNHKKENKYVCQFCSREFKRSFTYQTHVRRHSGQKPFQCTICGRAFTQSTNVKRHVETHRIWPHLAVNSNEVSCSNSGGHRMDSELKWLQMDDGETVVECALLLNCFYCQQSFADRPHLNKHLNAVHKDRKLFKCPQQHCTHTANLLSDFLAHLKQHDAQMTYKCPHCDKTYPSLREVGCHQHTHVFDQQQTKLRSTKTRLQCVSCGDQVSTVEGMQRHRMNAGHNIKCPKCDKIWLNARALRRHFFLAHSTFLPHKCQFCAARFSLKSILLNHEKTHGEATFACNRCGQKFKRKDLMLRHVSSVHSSHNLHICTYCARRFNRKDRMRKHMLNVHLRMQSQKKKQRRNNGI